MATPTMNISSAPKVTGGKFVPTNYGALSTLIVVFFFWGFIAAGNSVFIPFCKHYFHLDQFQSQLIDFAFYLAYYLGSAWHCLHMEPLVVKILWLNGAIKKVLFMVYFFLLWELLQ